MERLSHIGTPFQPLKPQRGDRPVAWPFKAGESIHRKGVPLGDRFRSMIAEGSGLRQALPLCGGRIRPFGRFRLPLNAPVPRNRMTSRTGMRPHRRRSSSKSCNPCSSPEPAAAMNRKSIPRGTRRFIPEISFGKRSKDSRSGGLRTFSGTPVFHSHNQQPRVPAPSAGYPEGKPAPLYFRRASHRDMNSSAMTPPSTKRPRMTSFQVSSTTKSTP